MDALGMVQFIHVRSSGVFSDTHTSDKYSPYCSDHILLSGFGVSGGPDIPKLSAGQGQSSLTMNRSNHPRHSSREVFVSTRKRHHGRIGIAGLLCHHILIPYGFMSERAFCLSPSLSSGVLTVFSSSLLSLLRLGFLILAVQR